MVYTFIVNPRAGRGLSRRSASQFLRALEQSDLTFDLVRTEYPRHAAELAREAARRSDVVVAVGGDGTVNEVVSGIVASGAKPRLAVVPIGSGNDFVKMLDVPSDPADLLRDLQHEHARPADYGRVRWDGPDGPGEGVFVNAAGAGIDAKIAETASRIKLLGGTSRYVAAVLITLRRWSAPELSMTSEIAGRQETYPPGEYLLVLASNGRCAAGGFFLTPEARIEDGLIDACVVRNTSLRRILRLIPAVLRGGRHVGAPEVSIVKTERIHIHSESPLAVQADGEALARRATDISFEVVQGGLSLAQKVKA